MLKKLTRAWKRFRALPWILQFAVFLAILLIGFPALASDRDPIVVGGQCIEGKLRVLQLLVPVPGMISIDLPEKTCPDAPTVPAKKPPADPEPPKQDERGTRTS